MIHIVCRALSLGVQSSPGFSDTGVPNIYKVGPKQIPPSPGHGDAYVAPGYAYQPPGSDLFVPGYAPESHSIAHKKPEGTTRITTQMASVSIKTERYKISVPPPFSPLHSTHPQVTSYHLCNPPKLSCPSIASVAWFICGSATYPLVDN